MEIKTRNIETENIEKDGTTEVKNEREWIIKKIQESKNNKDWERVNVFNSFLKIHNKFHPENVNVDIVGWKGKSGVEVEISPDYFTIKEWRKEDEKTAPKQTSHKIEKHTIKKIISALDKLILNKKYKTKIVAQIWAKENNILVNNDGRNIFNNGEFNFANIAGCRQTYFNFYWPIKIMEYYKKIKYYKTGHITRLEEDLNIGKQNDND